MPSLTRKLIKGRPYYYVRHCQRVDGRPKIVKTTYLGSVESLLEAAQSAQTPRAPKEAEISSLGDIAAIYDLAAQLDLVALIDQHIPKRDQGLSVGEYLLLAAINRAVAPTSKSQLAAWYRQTILTRLLPASALFGALLLLAADTAARLPRQQPGEGNACSTGADGRRALQRAC